MKNTMLPPLNETKDCRRIYKRTIRHVGKTKFTSIFAELADKHVQRLSDAHAGNSKVLAATWPLEKRKEILRVNLCHAQHGIIHFSDRDAFFEGWGELQKGLNTDGKTIVSFAANVIEAFYEKKNWSNPAIAAFYALSMIDKADLLTAIEAYNSTPRPDAS